MSPEKAIKEGAMALFGENMVKKFVVSMGKIMKIFSLELCGTHVEILEKLKNFQYNESSIASGVSVLKH